MSDPIEVLLQFAFLGVLYLFLLWVARSALRDLGRPAYRSPGFGDEGPDERRRARTRAGSWSSGAEGSHRARRSGSAPVS